MPGKGIRATHPGLRVRGAAELECLSWPGYATFSVFSLSVAPPAGWILAEFARVDKQIVYF